MKSRLLIAVCALLVLAVVFERSLVKPVLAQVRAALTKNIDEKGRVPYQEIIPCLRDSVNDPICWATTSPVPAGKRLVLQGIYGQFYGPSAPVVNLWKGDSPLALFQPFLWGSSTYGMNAPAVLFYAEAGETIFLRAGGVQTAYSSGSVTFTGYLVDLTQ